eukprot:IDg20639t1
MPPRKRLQIVSSSCAVPNVPPRKCIPVEKPIVTVFEGGRNTPIPKCRTLTPRELALSLQKQKFLKIILAPKLLLLQDCHLSILNSMLFSPNTSTDATTTDVLTTQAY